MGAWQPGLRGGHPEETASWAVARPPSEAFWVAEGVGHPQTPTHLPQRVRNPPIQERELLLDVCGRLAAVPVSQGGGTNAGIACEVVMWPPRYDTSGRWYFLSGVFSNSAHPATWQASGKGQIRVQNGRIRVQNSQIRI